MTEPAPSPGWRTSLPVLAGVFLRLGTISFGGPAAHIALMEEEVVRRRGWLNPQEFLDLLGATNLIPGPNSTELAIHVGHRTAGWIGLVVAGVCFILPATLIVTVVAWAYVTFGQLPQAAGLLHGIKPVVLAVVAQALWGLGRSCLRSWPLAVVAVTAAALVVAGLHELIVLFGAGVLLALSRALTLQTRPPAPPPLALLAAPVLPAAGAAATAPVPFALGSLFLFFVKVGSVLFGSGYVLLAFLRADLVERYGWLSETQLLDAVAVGQFTPGPVFTTATFIGYLLAGTVGAVVATVGIFLPAFVFVAASVPLLPRLRRSLVAGAFLDGVNAASLALMAVVAGQLGRVAVVDGITAALAIGSLVVLVRWRINSAWLILLGAAIGLLRTALLPT